MKITVRSPATSANLGSAFDCAGIAFALYNELSFALSERTEISGCEEKYANENNLACSAFKAVCDKVNVKTGVKIEFLKTDIPIARGLGSSASLITAGAVAANALTGNTLGKDELLKICAITEGHPDNVAPALFGGLCVSLLTEEKVFCVSSKPSEKIKFTAVIPDFAVKTQDARKALPSGVPFKDAVFNVSRAALALKAFESGDTDMIKAVADDRLHQRYRTPLYKNADEVICLAYSVGADCYFVSGAGPTFVFISEKDIAEDLNGKLYGVKNGWKALSLAPDFTGTSVV